MRQLATIEAIAEATREEMARDENVFVIGEDVDISGGVFKATQGVLEAHGARRVRGTPISESAFTGLAVGAAMAGLRPIVEFMYFDFVHVAMDQLVNQMAKLSTMSGGAVKTPVTVRVQTGTGTREAAQHSGSLEAMFVHTPGFKVVMPGTAYDAKGLLKSAIRDDCPVVYIENRNLYYKKEEVPEGEWIVPLGEAEVAREGADVTVVALGYARRHALEAAEKLEGRIDVEVIDPRTVQPLDIETIAASVEKTSRLLVAHEAPPRCGMGAEIIRRLVEHNHAFYTLDAAPRVVGGAIAPHPFSPALEDACMLQADKIVEAIVEICET